MRYGFKRGATALRFIVQATNEITDDQKCKQ